MVPVPGHLCIPHTMGTPQPSHKAAAWVSYQVEKEGIARLTILILLLTTVAMLAYTWGYAEGVHNSQTDLSEEIRLTVPPKPMPSIAELRSSTRTQQQQQEQQQQEEQQQPQDASTEQQEQLALPPDTSAQPEIAAAAVSQSSAPALEELEVLNTTDSTTSPQQPGLQRYRPIGTVRISPLRNGLGSVAAVDGVQVAPAPAPAEATGRFSSVGATAVSSGVDGNQLKDAATLGSSSSSDSGTAPAVAAAAAPAVVGTVSGGSIHQPHSRAGDGNADDDFATAEVEEYETTSDDYGH